MERKKAGIAFMVVMNIGAILSTVGMMIASGLDQGGTVYNAFFTTSMLFVLGTLVFYPDLFKDEKNQSQAEPDSSLI